MDPINELEWLLGVAPECHRDDDGMASMERLTSAPRQLPQGPQDLRARSGQDRRQGDGVEKPRPLPDVLERLGAETFARNSRRSRG